MKQQKKQTAASRENQIMAAAELVLLEVGIAHFTVDRVAEKAGIAKGTIYNYYETKNNILAKLGGKALNLLHQAFQEQADKEDAYINKFKSICHAHYQYAKKYPAYSELIYYIEKLEFNKSTEDYIRGSHKLTDYCADLVQKGQAAGEIRKNISPKLLTYLIWLMCIGMNEFLQLRKYILKYYEEVNMEMMIQLFNEILLEGIRD